MTNATPAQIRRPSYPAVVASGGLPPNDILLAKVIAASVEVGPLVKLSDHTEGWSFVSIDDYYAKAASVLLKHGVSWFATESKVGPVHDDYNAVGWTFSFTIYDNEGQMMRDLTTITIPHDIEGPQTAGKVMSYAEKVFLRQLMKLVTGEADADASPTKKGKGAERRPQPKVAAAPELHFDSAALTDQILVAGTPEALDLLIGKNKKNILATRDSDPDVYRKIADARTAKVKEFENAN